MADLVALIERARKSDDPAARELAERVARAIERPDRRVGAALTPRPRGGDQEPEQRAERDRALRELTELQSGSTQNARVAAARQKLFRYETNAWPRERDKPEETGNRERDLMRRIMRLGLPVPGER